MGDENVKGYGVKLLSIYNLNDRDWMNFKISKKNPLTYHHIMKRESGGKNEINNGALVTKLAHNFLHYIEYDDIHLYNKINDYFKIINENRFISSSELTTIKQLILVYLSNKKELPKQFSKEKIMSLIL